MHVIYDPDTLAVRHVIYSCHHSVADYHRAQPHHVEHPEHIPVEDIRLTRSDDGRVLVSTKRQFSDDLTAPETTKVGAELVFEPVPEGATILVNDTERGVMDASQRLEFTPETAGRYQISFVKDGHHRKDMRFEALP